MTKGRRRFIRALSCAPVATIWPALARSSPLRRLGVFQAGVYNGKYEASVARELAPLGYRLGDNLEIVSRWVGRGASATQAASELVEAKVDVILTSSSPFTRHAQSATRTIPIVTDVADPVGTGFARSLQRPGANVTGLYQGVRETSVKTLELLQALRPGLSMVGLIAFSGQQAWLPIFEDAAAEARLGVRRAYLDGTVEEPAKLEPQIASLSTAGCRAAHFYSQFAGMHARVAALALKYRIPLSTATGEQIATDGFLLSYRAFRSDGESLRRRLAIVARIFRGENPAEMPFEGPTRYLLSINRRTAGRLGISIPRELIVFADEIIG